MNRALAAALFMLLQACAHTGPGPLPPGVAPERDMRGAFRAALCAPDRLADECARVLRTYDREAASARPPPASPARHRLVFVPGFLASCFAGIHSFADVVEEARAAGFTADVLGVGGRNDVAANAKLIAAQIERITASDSRRIILVGHSKGANELLQVLVDRPDIGARVDGVLAVAGALQGSPLASDLRGLYDATIAIMPLSGCDRGEGDPVGDLTLEARAAWWRTNAHAVTTPIYALVTLPDISRLSFSLFWTYARLSLYTPDNDGMLRVQDQVVPSSRLLGIVNADHLTVAIPHPGLLYLLAFSPVPFPRPQVYMAAIDVIAAQRP
jgi:triacylglycerol lipase